MNIRYLKGAALEAKVDLLAISVQSTAKLDSLVKAADRALDGLLSQAMADQDFQARPGQSVVVPTRGELPARYIALIGAGEDGAAPQAARDITADAVRLGKSYRAKTAAVVLHGGRNSAGAAQQASLGALLGAYEFERYRSGGDNGSVVASTLDVATDRSPGTKKKNAKSAKSSREATSAIKRGAVIADAVCIARDLVNEPASAMTPALLAQQAKTMAKKHGLTARILGPKECEKLGMGMFLAVGQGSNEPAQLIHLTYKPRTKPKKRIALIGKGVTFDSGGYSLKPTSAMLDMKVDMAGSATVIGAMRALRDLGCKYEVHAVAACCENLISGNAYKLGDVLTAMDGTTVEINNTDAEGRLTLGDAMIYAREKIKPDEIIDFATLTGACVIALGPHTAGVFSNDDEMAGAFVQAARDAGEDTWRMPLIPSLRDQLKSPIADMRNTGERWGGAITAGWFLSHFAGDTPWVHVDIAGPATANKPHGATPQGATGFGVATVLEYLTR